MVRLEKDNVRGFGMDNELPRCVTQRVWDLQREILEVYFNNNMHVYFTEETQKEKSEAVILKNDMMLLGNTKNNLAWVMSLIPVN